MRGIVRISFKTNYCNLYSMINNELCSKEDTFSKNKVYENNWELKKNGT